VVRLASDGMSLNVVKDGVLAQVRRLFGGAESASACRDVRFAFVQAMRKAGVSVSPAVLRELGLAEDSKIADSACPLTCRVVRSVLDKVGDVERKAEVTA